MNKDRGFTLVEMMVVLSIFTLVMGIAYTALSLNETYRDLVLTKIQLYRQNKRALDSICAELQRSTAANWTTGGNPNTIRFQIPWVDAAYNVNWGANNNIGWFIRYRLNNNNLVRGFLNASLNPVGSEVIIAENITNLQFTNRNPPVSNYIGITIASQRRTIQRRDVYWTLVSAVFLRSN
jgi:prepilin-type N-terminal cleavage/methylation domain-containing protein